MADKHTQYSNKYCFIEIHFYCCGYFNNSLNLAAQLQRKDKQIGCMLCFTLKCNYWIREERSGLKVVAFASAD